MKNHLTHRDSPSYVREWSLADLHGVALHFYRQRAVEDLSRQQEWLYDRILSELAYRRRRAMRTRDSKPCVCWLCFGPFDDEDPQLLGLS